MSFCHKAVQVHFGKCLKKIEVTNRFSSKINAEIWLAGK